MADSAEDTPGDTLPYSYLFEAYIRICLGIISWVLLIGGCDR